MNEEHFRVRLFPAVTAGCELVCSGASLMAKIIHIHKIWMLKPLGWTPHPLPPAGCWCVLGPDVQSGRSCSFWWMLSLVWHCADIMVCLCPEGVSRQPQILWGKLGTGCPATCPLFKVSFSEWKDTDWDKGDSGSGLPSSHSPLADSADLLRPAHDTHIWRRLWAWGFGRSMFWEPDVVLKAAEP